MRELLENHKDLLVVTMVFILGVFFMIIMSNSEADMILTNNRQVGEASAKECHRYASDLSKNDLNITSELKLLQNARNACFHYITYLKAGETSIVNPQAELELAEKTMSKADLIIQEASR
jgi:hypothetical protein